MSVKILKKPSDFSDYDLYENDRLTITYSESGESYLEMYYTIKHSNLIHWRKYLIDGNKRVLINAQTAELTLEDIDDIEKAIANPRKTVRLYSLGSKKQSGEIVNTWLEDDSLKGYNAHKKSPRKSCNKFVCPEKMF